MYEKEVQVPEGVQIEVEGAKIKVSGVKGTVERIFTGMFGIKLEKSDKKIKISSDSDERKQKAVVGSIVAHIKNMFHGVAEGYEAKLKVIYSHFPVTVKVEPESGKILIQNFLGEKIPRMAKIIGNNTKVEVNGADIVVRGPEIEAVGQTAANMEQATKIRRHDRRVFQDGIYITKKPKEKE
jgi:large subunit ribosomal protein L6